MRPFKFFQKPVKRDLTMLDGQTRASASHNMFTLGSIGTTGSPGTSGSPGIGSTMDIPPLHEWDTPQGHNGRRRLYFTDHPEYERQRQIREDLRTALRTNALTQEEMLRVRHQAFQRMRNTNDDMERYFIENGFRDFNDNPVEQVRRRINGGSNLPKLKWHQRFLNELMDDKLILLVISVLGGIGLCITFFVYYYTQR
jgi:hypothetical protein